MIPPPEYMPALITPFTQRSELDIKAHTRNLRTLSEMGIDGFAIGGSNGEGPYLEPGERARLVKAGRRRKSHFMVGIAAESTRTALSLVIEATEAGADSLLVLTPTTVARNRDDAVRGFFKTIADEAEIPVFLYSVPLVTAYSLPVDLVASLSKHPNIVGMKDSSGDVVRLQSILDATPESFILYSGASRALTAAMAIGCYGAITGSGNYVPQLVLETMAAAKESPEKARRLQKRLSAVSAAVEAYGVPGVKAAARAARLDSGFPRKPLTRLPQGTEASIAKIVSTA